MQRNIRNTGRLVLLAVVWLLLAGCWNMFQSQPTLSAAAPRLGILGDSGADEYQGTDNRGGDYHAVTYNWVEHLVKGGRVSAGRWGDWGEPRRTGYEYNWARSGATARTLIEDGQHTGLAAQVANGEIDIVFISIGSNDFAPYRPAYMDIYSGALAGEALQAKIDQLVADVTLAVETMRAAGDVPILLITVPDWNFSAAVVMDARFADANRRQLVSEATAAVNAKLGALAEAQPGVTLVDQNQFGQQLLPTLQNGSFKVGGESINFMTMGDEPHNGVLGDNAHGGTVIEGLLANYYLDFINAALGTNLPPLSDEEILTRAGL